LRVYVISGFTTKTPEEKHYDAGYHPCVALIDVYHVVPDKTRDEATHANDYDADDERKGAGIDVGERLASENDCCCGKAEPSCD
jgi:hypothetical protein